MNGGVSPISSVAILSSLIFPVKESKGSELNQETRIMYPFPLSKNFQGQPLVMPLTRSKQNVMVRLAQRNLGKLSESNARVVVTKTKNGSLHKEILKLTPEKQYVITTVHEHSYLGRSTNTLKGGGILIYQTNRVVLVATYEAPVLQSEAVAYFERFVDEVGSL
jgi:hypothetical protein